MRPSHPPLRHLRKNGFLVASSESCPIAWLQKIFTAIAVRSARLPEVVPPTIRVGPGPCCDGSGGSGRRRREGVAQGPSAGTTGESTGRRPARRSSAGAMTVNDDADVALRFPERYWAAAARSECARPAGLGQPNGDVARILQWCTPNALVCFLSLRIPSRSRPPGTLPEAADWPRRDNPRSAGITHRPYQARAPGDVQAQEVFQQRQNNTVARKGAAPN
jgi:hypothetical protein